MGSTGIHRRKGQTNREFFAAQVLSPEHHEVLADITRREPAGSEWSNVYYAAVRDNRTGSVFALVIPFTRVPNPNAYTNFYYKTMDETVHPLYYDATAAILDALTDTTYEGAKEWRDKAREAVNAAAATPKVKRGDTVKFARALTFTSGLAADTLTFVERSTFRLPTGQLARIPNWKRLSFNVA
ncbi:DUF6927 domain-containing protein [Agromyces humi]|uniref:DUF6927 domain-containing protein n=1 Tax=Agromyces humi TaxID=1766800 RepID=UPI00135B258D|nr:hypothetical protein [Agromyces humi]